jgi:hypothetical protein
MIGIFTPSGMRVSTAKGPGNGPLRITGRQHETVRGRFLRQHLKQEWSHKLQMMVYVERIFDRVERVYHETYYHPITGEVIFEKHPDIEDQSESAHGPRGKRQPDDAS